MENDFSVKETTISKAPIFHKNHDFTSVNGGSNSTFQSSRTCFKKNAKNGKEDNSCDCKLGTSDHSSAHQPGHPTFSTPGHPTGSSEPSRLTLGMLVLDPAIKHSLAHRDHPCLLYTCPTLSIACICKTAFFIWSYLVFRDLDIWRETQPPFKCFTQQRGHHPQATPPHHSGHLFSCKIHRD